MTNATPKQLFALFCATGLNTRNCKISIQEASNLISKSKKGTDITEELKIFGAIGEAKKSKNDWKSIFEEADKAGKEAANKCIPVPMIVQERSNVLDDTSSIKKQYFVEGGVCGFASIRFKANTSFAKWAIKNNIAKKSSMGGCYIWVSDYGQSMQLKESYSSAFAKILRDKGIEAYSESRMD